MPGADIALDLLLSAASTGATAGIAGALAARDSHWRRDAAALSSDLAPAT